MASKSSDLPHVVPLPLVNEVRKAIEGARRILESKTSPEEDRTDAIDTLEDIYHMHPTNRTTYHFAFTCWLLAAHSAGAKERKAYANRCLSECRRKLKEIDEKEDKMAGEGSISISLYGFLQKKGQEALDVVAAELSSERRKRKLEVTTPKKQAASSHIKKKKKVAKGQGVAVYDDEDEDSEDDNYEDIESPDGQGSPPTPRFGRRGKKTQK